VIFGPNFTSCGPVGVRRCPRAGAFAPLAAATRRFGRCPLHTIASERAGFAGLLPPRASRTAAHERPALDRPQLQSSPASESFRWGASARRATTDSGPAPNDLSRPRRRQSVEVRRIGEGGAQHSRRQRLLVAGSTLLARPRTKRHMAAPGSSANKAHPQCRRPAVSACFPAHHGRARDHAAYARHGDPESGGQIPQVGAYRSWMSDHNVGSALRLTPQQLF